ncbi:MAG: hypothetical protein COU11_01480 [Candidatus Harrisonbacteria bacterium CG10_big_fil_rev_8_21_14_0_10_49_15]|uniref:Uncharacterized protein n=1 Tax=Candidatus Harrisonbacteria bacterium CG10_big_fil_rev_8_21_14_0_10_49_15 TaxID=1974587 RepID=A0A2H0ULC2_9BACT|nr:MAG: hypothetical protein COU11_01480 [Candidatus Harrisonbacteria bacterium CG10_big_fil_rev_8_21_14_0_10_49_15]
MSDKKSWILLVIVLIVVVVAGYMFFTYQQESGQALSTDANTSKYQAVFLDNNQVYFGQITSTSGDFITLQDIYYLQVNQRLQPIQEGETPANNPDISLVKLGGELHGPTDEMRINKDHVLIIEDLRKDSNLVGAIEQYVANQAATQ